MQLGGKVSRGTDFSPANAGRNRHVGRGTITSLAQGCGTNYGTGQPLSRPACNPGSRLLLQTELLKGRANGLSNNTKILVLVNYAVFDLLLGLLLVNVYYQEPQATNFLTIKYIISFLVVAELLVNFIESTGHAGGLLTTNHIVICGFYTLTFKLRTSSCCQNELVSFGKTSLSEGVQDTPCYPTYLQDVKLIWWVQVI